MSSSDKDKNRADIRRHKLLMHALHHRFFRVSEKLCYQDVSACGAEDFCRRKGTDLDPEYGYHMRCDGCFRGCHLVCMYTDEEGIPFLCPDCFGVLKSEAPSGHTQGPTRNLKITLHADLRQTLNQKVAAWQGVQCRMLPALQFDSTVRAALNFPLTRAPLENKKYIAIERAMNAALGHVCRFPEIFKRAQAFQEETGKVSALLVTCPSMSSLADVSKAFEPRLIDRERTIIWPDSISATFLDLDDPDFPFPDGIHMFDASFQMPILLACRARETTLDVVIKMKILSDLSQAPSNQGPHLLPFSNARELSRGSELYATTMPSDLVERSFELPMCAYCDQQERRGEEALRCASCNATRYCSRDCQTADWDYVCDLHKAERKQAKALTIYHRDEHCGYCDAPAKDGKRLQVCTGCRCIKYCGRECQVADRPVHKRECWMAKSTWQNKYPKEN